MAGVGWRFLLARRLSPTDGSQGAPHDLGGLTATRTSKLPILAHFTAAFRLPCHFYLSLLQEICEGTVIEVSMPVCPSVP